MHFPSLHGEQHDYSQYVSEASDLWSSNSTSKNYCQENNHGYVEKLTDKQSIVQTRKREERERGVENLMPNNRTKENCDIITHILNFAVIKSWLFEHYMFWYRKLLIVTR